jgi:hypothetical protein
MNEFWMNFSLEIALFSFLGILYYFYQKRKIIQYEENKTPIVMNYILQACLSEKKDSPQMELDLIIESIDDFLKSNSNPPIASLKKFSQSSECSLELKEVILAGLKEIGA